jgi:hypothetical protein
MASMNNIKSALMAKTPKLGSDERMIDFIELLQHHEVIRYRQEFLDVIGMKKQHFTNIQAGAQSFTVEHITRACDYYNVNANWILGLEENMFRVPLTVEMKG